MTDLDLIEVDFNLKDSTSELESILSEPKENTDELLDIHDSFFCYNENNEKKPKVIMRIEPFLKINGIEINFYFDVLKFLNTKEAIENDDLYLFTCSCGEAGCAKIWEPIQAEINGELIHFIIPKNAGYTFLDKDKYTFSLEQYKSQISSFISALEKQSEYMNSKSDLIITLDNSFDFNESIDDFLDFYNKSLKNKSL